MNRPSTGLAGLLLVLTAAPRIGAQTTRDVEVEVTSLSGRDVYLDKGRDAGLREGDTVVLQPPGAAPAEATITDVSRTHSRARLDDQRAVVSLGVVGRVRVPVSRFSGEWVAPAPPGTRPIPDHPPWTGELPWDAGDTPLLAPIRGRTVGDRPARLFGRAWFRATAHDNRFAGDNRYLFLSTGSDTTVENPFSLGGEFRFRGDLNYRDSQLALVEDQSLTRFRIDRLSYRHGYASDDGIRFQVGRFLQTLAPALGLVDGAELDVRVGGSSRVGVSFGGFPEPRDTGEFSDDRQFTAFYRYGSDAERTLEVGVGFQRTWHDGERDRDLALFDLFWKPDDQVTVYADLWVDYYDSSAVNKSVGLEITRFQGSANWTIDDFNGLAMYVDYFAFPELLREEFRPVEPDSTRDDYVLRTTLSSWHVLSDRTRLDLRLAPWRDQSGSGLGAEARVTLIDVLYDQGYAAFDLFRSDGTYEGAFGGRVTLGHRGSVLATSLSYERAWYDYDRQPPDSTVLNQAFSGSLSLHALSGTDVSLDFDYRFGDTQDSLAVGLFLQSHF